MQDFIDLTTLQKKKLAMRHPAASAALALAAFLVGAFTTYTFVEPVSTRATYDAMKEYYEFSPFVSLRIVEERVKSGMYKAPNVACELCLVARESEGLLMYELGRAAAGPVLEEGSFCGCSTSFIGLGLLARDNSHPHAFFTSDVFPLSPKHQDIVSPNR